jgi:general secretion pathway protein K
LFKHLPVPPPALRCLTDNSGMALLITLTVITLLVAVTLELNRRARATVHAAAETRDRLVISEMLASGVHAAMAMLAEDKKNSAIDSIQEDWANPERVSAMVENVAPEEGKLTVTISDERSRIQVNALVKFPEGRAFQIPQPTIWERYLKIAFLAYELEAESDQIATIINSLKDWLDSGDDDAITGLSGAESDYYQDLDPGYSTRNGPFTDISELLQVRGVLPEIFYSNGELPGISDYLTVGVMTTGADDKFTFDGKININTAELTVLAALLKEEDQELAVAIEDYRMARSDETYLHELSGSTWYQDVPGAGDIEIDADAITTKSDFFRIEVHASLREMKMSANVLIRREKNKENDQIRCRVLSWKQE